jgi:hypothetical protein
MQFRIDGSGNTIVAPDTATTSAKFVALYLVTALEAGGTQIEYHPDSVISDIAYDFATHELSWLERGQQGRQTVTIENESLRAALGLIHEHAQAPTASDIATAVASSIDLSNIATLQSVADARDAVIAALPPSVDTSTLATAEQLTQVTSAVESVASSVVNNNVYMANETQHTSNELEILESVRAIRAKTCRVVEPKKEN